MTGPEYLAPGESILFISQGGTEEQDEQLLGILKETWLLVPAGQRRTIYGYYSKLFNGWPIARLGYLGGVATAGGPKDPFMLWFGLPAIFELPRGEQDMMLAIAEELAHTFMYASGHESHMKDPPNKDRASPEFLAWDKGREDAMKAVLYSWPFVDRAEHEALCSAVLEKARLLRKKG